MKSFVVLAPFLFSLIKFTIGEGMHTITPLKVLWNKLVREKFPQITKLQDVAGGHASIQETLHDSLSVRAHVIGFVHSLISIALFHNLGSR
jgi:hypothetical protein